jgi:hypothetical protein
VRGLRVIVLSCGWIGSSSRFGSTQHAATVAWRQACLAFRPAFDLVAPGGLDLRSLDTPFGQQHITAAIRWAAGE